ncbi:hypothetical protein GCM10009753_04930 [Streptantibioticus ferralitis]
MITMPLGWGVLWPGRWSADTLFNNQGWDSASDAHSARWVPQRMGSEGWTSEGHRE